MVFSNGYREVGSHAYLSLPIFLNGVVIGRFGWIDRGKAKATFWKAELPGTDEERLAALMDRSKPLQYRELSFQGRRLIMEGPLYDCWFSALVVEEEDDDLFIVTGSIHFED